MEKEIKSSLCNIFKINVTHTSKGKWHNLEFVLRRKKIVWISGQVKWTKQKTSRRTMKSPLYFLIITVFWRLSFLNYDFRQVIWSEVSPALLMLRLKNSSPRKDREGDVGKWQHINPMSWVRSMQLPVSLKTKCQYTSDSSACGATGHDLNLVSFHPFNGTESADF